VGVRLYDFHGLRFGRLLVLEYVGDSKWRCLCNCKQITIVTTSNLRSGSTQSCGCLFREIHRDRQRKHGFRKDPIPEYWIWLGIKRRCRPGSKDAKYYADLGVTLHPEWAESFKLFYDYVGPRPAKGYSIDRWPNPSGNYEPGNIRWATASEQAKNRRNAHMITFNGKTKNLLDWADELGMRDSVLCRRLQRGWTIERALNPEHKIGKKLSPEQVRVIRDAKGTGSLRQIGQRFGVNPQTVLNIQRGDTWKRLD
jgi:hypothetical protein